MIKGLGGWVALLALVALSGGDECAAGGPAHAADAVGS